MSIYQTCPSCGLSTSEGGAICELCVYEKMENELNTLRIENGRLREALQLIATPKRPDGTYNRSREACEQLARDALEKK